MLYKKEGSSKWWYSFTYHGTRVQRSSGVENRQDAQDIEAAHRTNLARGEVGIDEKPSAERKTVGQMLDVLENDFKARQKDTPKNLNLIAIVRKDLADRWADTMTTTVVTEYVTSLRKAPKKKQKGRRSKSLADSTIKHRLQILASAYELENASREEAKLDPLVIPRFPKLTKDNVRSGFLNRAQFDVLYSHLPEDLKDFSLFLYITGWRRGAVASLEWNDVRDGNVYLRGVKSKNGKPYFVPVLGELTGLIKRREEARSVETPQGIVLSNLVFHRASEPILEFRKAWTSACKKAGCPGTIVHDMRRSAARNLIRAGVDKDIVKMIGGWKTDSMLTRYNVTGEADLAGAMEDLKKYSEAQSQKIETMEASR